MGLRDHNRRSIERAKAKKKGNVIGLCGECLVMGYQQTPRNQACPRCGHYLCPIHQTEHKCG